MGIVVAGHNDNIHAHDGSLSIDGLSINTPTGIVTAQKFVGSGAGLTGLNVKFDPDSQENLYAGTGAGGAGIGATNGPVVAVVTGTNGGAGVAITNMAVTGLTASTSYDIYCATNDGSKVLSNKVDFTTTGG